MKPAYAKHTAGMVMETRPNQQILENLATTVVTLDGGLRLTSINPAGEALFETSAKKVTGRTITELLPRSDRLVRRLQQAIASGHPFTAREVSLPLAGGREITVDCMVTPVAEGGKGKQLIIELTQVDRLMRLTRDGDMLDRSQANRAVIRGLAHEIKNPLGGLRGAAQLLERELSDRSLKEYTRIVIHEADRLRNLVDRMIGPNMPLQKKPVNIHEVLEHVRNLINVEFAPRVTINRDYDPSLPELPADRDQLIQATLNIVKNSVQALKGDGVIKLRTRPERKFTIGKKCYRLVLAVDIEDNGPGIPESLREHIFYPMVTGRPEGTGLGLSIAQDIIHKHGGLIECNSQPGRTVFTIYLPTENGNG